MGTQYLLDGVVVIISDNEANRVHSEGREGRCIHKELPEETLSSSVVLKHIFASQ